MGTGTAPVNDDEHTAQATAAAVAPPVHKVNFSDWRGFGKEFKSDLKETFFPDDPFKLVAKEKSRATRAKKVIQYFVPIFEWAPTYTFSLFRYDLLAGITIASLAIPQGISYANLAQIPPIIGLYSSFVPPIIYAIFGCSRNMAVGTVAAASLLLAETLQEKVDPSKDPTLYLNLVFTATLFTGLFQTALGILRLGILVDFLSHSTITGFMTGTAVIIILQQLKGVFGLKHFTHRTDVVSVIRAIFANRKEWRWETTVAAIIFLIFLQAARILKTKKPRLFWISAMAPLVTVIVGGLFAYFTHAERFGIQIVGKLQKGINPLSINRLVFDSKYVAAPIKGGIITGIIALAEGIAIGRSFGIMKNQQIDGNKETIAFGLMNIAGSLTSCYLTTGPFSKTAVNVSAGCRTQMSNMVMAICMMLTLLVLAPLFSYTPLVALSAIIMTAMFGLIDYEKIYHIYKVDKYDFLICMTAVFGVAFVSMDVGLGLSVFLGLLRALLYTARPESAKLGNVQGSHLYRDIQQYPVATGFPGILVLQMGSPVYFSNSTYIRERIMRWIRDEDPVEQSQVEHLVLDLGGVTAIDMTGIETFFEIKRMLDAKDIRIYLVNPRRSVMHKLIAAEFIEAIGTELVFLSIGEAVNFCQYRLSGPRRKNEIDLTGSETA